MRLRRRTVVPPPQARRVVLDGMDAWPPTSLVLTTGALNPTAVRNLPAFAPSADRAAGQARYYAARAKPDAAPTQDLTDELAAYLATRELVAPVVSPPPRRLPAHRAAWPVDRLVRLDLRPPAHRRKER
jgi:hypothetical protein